MRTTCERCNGKPTVELSELQEKELIGKIICVMKEYKLSFGEAKKILKCVNEELNTMSEYLHL